MLDTQTQGYTERPGTPGRGAGGQWEIRRGGPKLSTEPVPPQPCSMETPTHMLQTPRPHMGDASSWQGPQPHLYLLLPTPIAPPGHPSQLQAPPLRGAPSTCLAPSNRSQAVIFVPVGLCSVWSQSEGSIPEGSLLGETKTAGLNPQWGQRSPSLIPWGSVMLSQHSPWCTMRCCVFYSQLCLHFPLNTMTD